MTKERRDSNRRGDPNQDVQPWLGWIAALLVVVIVVVAVAMGMARTNDQQNNAAEVRMTPLVGGMQIPVATETGQSVAAISEVTPLPETISETNSITMVTVITTTDGVAATSEMTPAVTISVTEGVSPSGEVTSTTEVSETGTITATEEMTGEVTIEPTAEPTVEPTAEPTVEATATVEPTATPEPTASEEPTETVAATTTEESTAEATATPTPRPTATPRSTATPRPTATVVAQNFETGDVVVARGERVGIYADASTDALVLDNVSASVALEVLDPSGDFEDYPVVVDGVGWARVRAEDGLVGWVRTDQVEAQ